MYSHVSIILQYDRLEGIWIYPLRQKLRSNCWTHSERRKRFYCASVSPPDGAFHLLSGIHTQRTIQSGAMKSNWNSLPVVICCSFITTTISLKGRKSCEISTVPICNCQAVITYLLLTFSFTKRQQEELKKEKTLQRPVRSISQKRL